MMVEHIVLFRMQEGTPAEKVDHLLAELRGLKASIPEVVGLSCGRNFTDRGKGYEVGLVVRLKDRPSLAVYRDHPEHQRVLSDAIKPIVADVLAMDYEIA